MRSEFKILTPGEYISAGDQLMSQGGWRKVPDHFVGTVVQPKHAGTFRRVFAHPSDENNEN